MLRKNAGRSSTLNPRSQREYLLKGLVRCIQCGRNAWAQTYMNGKRYYREKRASSGTGECPGKGGSVACDIPDEQVGRIVTALELPSDWLERTLELISEQDEVTRVREEGKRAKERLRRLGRVYLDGLFPEGEYRRQKQLLDTQLESLVIPEIDATEEAGRLLTQLPELWDRATLGERHELLTRMLDGVYVDMKGSRSVVAIKPKPAFRPLFRIATMRTESRVKLLQ